MVIRLATREDIPAVRELEARYFVGNLDVAERTEGFISILHTPQWFEAAVESDGLHLAFGDTGVVEGFMAVTPVPTQLDVGTSPIVAAMLKLTQSTSFNGVLVSKQRVALRGPVLIDRPARGRGVYSAFNSLMRKVYAPRYDLGVLFVAAENERSLHTTTTKLGAQNLATFEVNARQYHFLAFEF